MNRTITLPSDAEFIRLTGKNSAVPVPVAAIDALNDINGDYSTAQVVLSGQRSSGTIVRRSWEYILGAAGGFVTIIMGAFAGVAAGIRAFDVIVCGGCLSCGSIEPTEEELAKKAEEGDDGGDIDSAEGGSRNPMASAPAPAPQTTTRTGAKAGFADEV